MIPHEIKKDEKPLQDKNEELESPPLLLKLTHTHTPLIIIVVVKPLAIMKKEENLLHRKVS